MKSQRTQVKFEVYGVRYVAQLGTMQPDWSDHRRPYYPSHVDLTFDIVERPEFGADEVEWKAWKKASITLAQPIVDAALALFGVEEKARFSQRKLCSCGCSPAWIIESSFHPVHGRSYYIDIARVENADALASGLIGKSITEQPMRETFVIKP